MMLRHGGLAGSVARLRWPRRSWAEPVAAGLLAFGLFFAGTGSLPLVGRDEPRFAEAAREMLARGDLVVPTFGGVNRYDKPILVYWCTMASYAVLGVTPRAARLPSNLAGALTVALLAFWARRRWGPGWGLLAGALLAVTLTFALEAKACTADMVMLLPTVAAMLALEALVTGTGGAGAAAVLWLGMALSLLAKGPVGPATAVATGVAAWALARRWPRWQLVVLAALVLLGWWRLGPVVLALPLAAAVVDGLRRPGGRRLLARLRWWWGVPLLLALTLPWAVAAWQATDGAFFRVGVGKHVVARSLTALESHGGFPGFYLVTAVIVAFPWFALSAGLWPRLRALAADPVLRFRLAWAVGPLVMLELVETKLVHYWMPSYPAGILLVVGWLASGGEEPVLLGRWPRGLLGAGAVLVAAVPVGVALHFGLTPLAVHGAVAAVPLLATGLWAALAGRQDPRLATTVVATGTAVFLAVLFILYLPALGRELVGPRAAARALDLRAPGETLVVYEARDDELFFQLPLGAVNCRAAACLDALGRAGGDFLGIARARDLDRFTAAHPEARFRTVERVRGMDLGHGRWVEMALFRPAYGGATP